MMDHDRSVPAKPPGFWGTRYAIGLIIIGAVAGYFLLTEHLAHVVGALPFLLLLACPLMHVFMHRGHGSHGHHHGENEQTSGPGKSDQPNSGERS